MWDHVSMVGNGTPNLVGVVLAGGESRRMRTDKALVEVGGRPMLSWVLDALDAVVEDTVIAGPARDRWKDRRFLEDSGSPQRGPLSGVSAAMESVAPGTVLVVVAVDQPWVRTQTLEAIAGSFVELPVVPVPDGVRQTTCAAYPADLSLVAIRELNAGGSIQSMLDRTAFDPLTEADISACGEDGRSWFSVDTAEDLATGLERYGPPAGG